MSFGFGFGFPRGGSAGAWSPFSLFTSGAKGAWYDPSDYTSLFQDSAGTTAVTAVESPVGLMLDKSQGLVLGPELVITPYSGAASGGWGFSGNTITRDGITAGGTCTLTITARSSATARAQITFTVSGLSGDTFSMQSGTGNAGSISTNGAKSFIFDTTSTTGIRFIAWGGGVGSAVISNISVKELPGNHASQATTASRPVLRARYNLLTYSEQFDNAAWFAGSTTVSANQATAPDLTVTADLVYPTSSGASRYIWRNAPVFTASAQVITSSFYIKSSSWTWVMVNGTGTNTGVWFNISTGQKGTENSGYTGTITDAQNGWWRVTVTETRTGSVQPTVFLADANSSLTATASGTNGIYVWGADLRYGSSAGTYQRIAAATDYDTAGFLPYLALDGTDDSFATGSIDFSATDKMAVCAGVTKLSDATSGCILELSTNFALNAGSFAMFTGSNTAAGPQYNFSSRGNATAVSGQTANSTTAFAAPITNVVTGQGDISGDLASLRINGAANGTNGTTDQGAGNFGNYALYIGRRGGSTFPLNGRLYQIVVCGKTLSASELASTEAFVNQKTGAY